MGIYIKGMTKEGFLKTFPALHEYVIEVEVPHGDLVDIDDVMVEDNNMFIDDPMDYESPTINFGRIIIPAEGRGE